MSGSCVSPAGHIEEMRQGSSGLLKEAPHLSPSGIEEGALMGAPHEGSRLGKTAGENACPTIVTDRKILCNGEEPKKRLKFLLNASK
jgi:hypothetical protein